MFSTEICNIIDNDEHNYGGSNASESTPQFLIPGLPVERFLSPASLTVIVSQVGTLPEDVDRYYEICRSAADEGDGFSVEEFPTKELFWKIFGSNYNVVLEDKYSGKWVAVFYIGSSAYSRSRETSDVADAGMIIAKEFRNSGLGSFILIEIVWKIAADLGCRVMYTDVPVHHIASIVMTMHCGYAISGTLPRAFYSPVHGWSDVLLFTKSFNTVSKL